MATQEAQVPSIIGAAVPRIDGRLKTSGGAMYSSDYHFPGMVYLVPVCSSIAKGKIEGGKITLETAEGEGPAIKFELVLEGDDHIKGDATGSHDGQTMKAKLDVTRVKS